MKITKTKSEGNTMGKRELTSTKKFQVIKINYSGGAVIKQMFNDLYKEYIQPNFKVTNEYND